MKIPRTPPRNQAFTLVELLVVIVIILILAGLVIQVSGAIQRKAYRERARTEMQAMASALENYKIDYGTYPILTDADPTSLSVPPDNSDLRQALQPQDPNEKVYFEFPNNMGGTNETDPILDPFGYPYGYFFSTDDAEMTAAGGTPGFFMLWSNGGQQETTNQMIFVE